MSMTVERWAFGAMLASKSDFNETRRDTPAYKILRLMVTSDLLSLDTRLRGAYQRLMPESTPISVVVYNMTGKGQTCSANH